ncbi:MAG: hypothetical protein IKS83_06340, partial [Victivallales bacterium]|nr:hypothetical protein [Victivallales bacterium]
MAQAETPIKTFDLDELLKIEAPPPPADFDEFWRRTYREATEKVPAYRVEREVWSPTAGVKILQLRFTSHDGFDIGLWGRSLYFEGIQLNLLRNDVKDDASGVQVGIYNTVKGSYVSSTWYGESVTGASVQGRSYSSLGEITPTQMNFIPKTTFSYTPSECSSPKDLTETDITFNSATLNWTGYQDSYDLRYRKKPLYFEDFENGLPTGWTTIDNDGDGYDWHSESNYA